MSKDRRHRKPLPRGLYRHPINRNLKEGEEKVLVSVWDFGGTMPQKERKHYKQDNFPARMRPPLARALLQLYAKSPVLDPMCGSGTTNMEAALLGMESYGIDIEAENIALCKTNIPQLRGRVELQHLFRSSGDGERKHKTPIPVFQQGDARMLPFKEDTFGGIVFSPPYWNAIGKHKNVSEEYAPPYIKRRGKPKTWRARNLPYGKMAGQLGNIRNYKKYLTEMEKIMGECFRVLKAGHFCACVVKDLQRNYRLIPLHSDIITRGVNQGFELYDLIINKMYHQVFWAVHHAMNEQFDMGMPRSLRTHEYVIVFIKQEE